MWTLPKNWSSLRQKCKKWIQKEQVLDVVLFGSSVRGKRTPRDIDLCILLRNGQEKRTLELIQSLHQHLDTLNLKFHLTALTEETFIQGKETIIATLLQEGISLARGKLFSTRFGLIPYSLFFYSLQGASPSRRVRFHYLLRGRGKRTGVLSTLQGELLRDGIVMVPTENEDTFQEILLQWKVTFTGRRILAFPLR